MARRCPVAAFREVADRVWVARHEWFDVNVTPGRRGRGLLVVDTHGSAAGGAAASSSEVRALGAGEVVGDRQHPRALRPHLRQRRVPRGVRRRADPRPRGAARDDGRGGRRGQGSATATTRTTRAATRCWRPRSCRADHTFSSRVALDLGDRQVELVHPGRGHTGGDLVVRVPDADVLLAGDLVEEPRPRRSARTPGRWTGRCSLDIVLGLSTSDLGRRARARRPRRPGLRRGAAQRRSGSSPRRSATSPPAACPSTRRSPRPSGRTRAEGLADAVRRGYEQLPRSQRRLPLV